MGIETAIIGSAALGAGASIYGSNKAAKAQTNAANMANSLQWQMYNQQRNDLMPYMNFGKEQLGDLEGRMPFLTSPIQMDQAALEQTPGYQFLLSQGMKNIQANAAARGLGNSGTAIKAGQRFGIDLANTTYKDQFGMENINRTNSFNRLLEASRLGQSAASGVGAAGTAAGQGMAANTIGAGNAQAGAYMAGANAIGSGANSIMQYAMMKEMMGGGNMYGSQVPQQQPDSYFYQGGQQFPMYT